MGKVRQYESTDITIFYDVARCIHFEECIHGAPGVFEKTARPWVNAEGDSPDRTAAIIQLCPTGALHYHAKNEALNEVPDPENAVTVTENGPLLARGDLEITLPDGPIRETRAALCRCGASANKPFCDNSHKRVGFTDPGPKASGAPSPDAQTRGKLAFTPVPNGPLLAKGHITVRNPEGVIVSQPQQTAFCRCGGSANKPFCDGSHSRIGFTG